MRRITLAWALGLAACGEAPAAVDGSIVPAPPATAVAPAVEAGNGLSAERFRELIETLSEPDAEFFSDNFVSNETSYLQAASKLEREVARGGVYLGVGPEQNFSYIALTEPSRAFIVDIRRDNLVLMLLYKAAFDLAGGRAHFLALVTGRPFDAADHEPPEADVRLVMALAERQPATETSFAAAHAAIVERITGGYGIALDARDLRSLRRAHEALYTGGLDLRFRLKDQSFRRYPSLRELLAATDPEDGVAKGFMASDRAFRRVQRMQRENRIVPLVGDFAGDGALPRLAAHLAAENLTVSAFYVSNVEQYLLADGKWQRWQRNVRSLPSDDKSVFIRCYLDQGRAHPEQLPGHRTATTLQRLADFAAHPGPYPSMLALASDRTL